MIGDDLAASMVTGTVPATEGEKRTGLEVTGTLGRADWGMKFSVGLAEQGSARRSGGMR